jgi:DNA-directed RNA polymerase subunit RPC12/RpoP
MEPVTLIISLALVVGALALIFYPLWQQTRPEAIFRVNPAGQTLEEYEARYQATLASIKDLMFDYEMGKVSADDYETLLHRSKLEAAQIRRQIDRLGQGDDTLVANPALDAEIEALVSQLRGQPANGNGALLQEIDAEIESLKQLAVDAETDGPACPNCGKGYQAGDAFCTGCGQALPEPTAANLGERCPECGSPVEADDAFCAKCGFALTEDVPA